MRRLEVSIGGKPREQTRKESARTIDLYFSFLIPIDLGTTAIILS